MIVDGLGIVSSYPDLVTSISNAVPPDVDSLWEAISGYLYAFAKLNVITTYIILRIVEWAVRKTKWTGDNRALAWFKRVILRQGNGTKK